MLARLPEQIQAAIMADKENRSNGSRAFLSDDFAAKIMTSDSMGRSIRSIPRYSVAQGPAGVDARKVDDQKGVRGPPSVRKIVNDQDMKIAP
ncbi:hypothetical protein D5047_22975 [Verminephrobacter eiseniae]|nr:hypothetical protein [Verminephrobacter eiseniae]